MLHVTVARYPVLPVPPELAALCHLAECALARHAYVAAYHARCQSRLKVLEGAS